MIHAAHRRKNVIASQCAHWRDNLLLQDTAPQTRNNGRTRDPLPIEDPAPRPCSTSFSVPTHTFLGSLTGFQSVLFSSPLFTYLSHYSPKQPDLSTPNCADKLSFRGAAASPPLWGGCPRRGRERCGTMFRFSFALRRKRTAVTPLPTRLTPGHLPLGGRYAASPHKQQFTVS